MLEPVRSGLQRSPMPRHLLPALLILVAVLGVGCRRGGPPPAIAPAAVPPIAPSEVIYYDNGGGIRDSVRLVVRDPDQLQTLWEQATSTQLAPPPLPSVDFSREMVLVIGAGRMTPDDQIQVDSVGVRDEATPGGGRQRVLEVVVRTTRGCQQFNSDAYPVVFVRVQSFDGTVRFTERREQAAGCDPGALLERPSPLAVRLFRE
jgi:hypothetical protein